jgi:hypothetical protein
MQAVATCGAQPAPGHPSAIVDQPFDIVLNLSLDLAERDACAYLFFGRIHTP